MATAGVLQHAPYVLLYAAVEALAIVALCLFVLPAGLKQSRLAVANMWTSIVVAALLGISSTLAVSALYASAADRWFGTTRASHFFLDCYVGHNLLLIVLDLVEDAPLLTKLPMLAHHLLSCIAYGGGMQTHRMHFYACLDGMCELCNLFLNPFLLTRHKEADYGESLAARLGAGVVMINNLLLWLSFLLFRMLLFPAWLATFAFDIRAMFLRRTAVLAGQEAITWFEVTFYPAVTLFLLVLSTLWFTKLTKGALKELRKGRTKAA